MGVLCLPRGRRAAVHLMEVCMCPLLISVLLGSVDVVDDRASGFFNSFRWRGSCDDSLRRHIGSLW